MIDIYKIIKDTCHVFHMALVIYETGEVSYKAEDCLKNFFHKRYLKRLNKKDPGHVLEKNAKTLYEFEALGNLSSFDINNQAKEYLINMKKSIKELKNLQKYFSSLDQNLISFIKILNDNKEKDYSRVLTQLSRLESKLESFSDSELANSFSLKAPPREILYVAEYIGTSTIIPFNKKLKKIKSLFNVLNDLDQNIKNHSREFYNHITPLIFSNELTCNETFIWSEFDRDTLSKMLQQFDETMRKPHPIEQSYSISFENDRNWLPLSIDEEQKELGERVFLELINKASYSSKTKLQLGEIFLSKSVSHKERDQSEIEFLSHKTALVFRKWQCEKCEEIIKDIETVDLELDLETTDTYGLIEWIKEKIHTKEDNKNLITLLKKILINPCCLSGLNIESTLDKIKLLLSTESHEEKYKLFQQYQHSQWGAILENNDKLIQLPIAFDIKTLSKEYKQSNKQLTFPTEIQNRRSMIIAYLKKLNVELINRQNDLREKLNPLEDTVIINNQELKNQERKLGVKRIKQAHRMLGSECMDSDNILFPFLLRNEMISEEERRHKIPTVEDFLQILFRGLKPDDICYWQPNPNSLLSYFIPDQNDLSDFRIEVWNYAYTQCIAGSQHKIPHLLSTTTDPSPLALENSIKSELPIKNSPMVKSILKDTRVVSFANTNNMALREMPPKLWEKVNIIGQEFQDSYVISFVRLNKKQFLKLPMGLKGSYLYKNFFRFNRRNVKIEEFNTCKVQYNNYFLIFSKPTINTMKEAISTFYNVFKDKSQNLLSLGINIDNSPVGKIMAKAFNHDSPIIYLLIQNPTLYQSPTELSQNESQNLNIAFQGELNLENDQFKVFQEQIRNKLRHEVRDEVKEEVRDEVKYEVRVELKAEYDEKLNFKLKEQQIQYEKKIKEITQTFDLSQSPQQSMSSSIKPEIAHCSKVKFF